jgi:hypothetical protein
MIQNKIVVHYLDGRILKGVSADFFPNKTLFHLMPVDSPPSSQPAEVQVSELKAVFFVKDFAGNPEYNDRKEFDPSKPVSGRKIRVEFKDGEVIVGTTQGYQPGRPGFFVVPADPQSNNERCFVVSSATTDVSFV